MKLAVKSVILFLIGGAVYGLLELLWRGFTHPSMFILGGLCFLLIGGINNRFGWDTPLLLQILIGVILVTLLEFVAGLILNVWLGLEVWDYSNLPANIMGQTSLPYMILWIPLTCAAIFLDDWIRFKFFGEERPRYNLAGNKLKFSF